MEQPAWFTDDLLTNWTDVLGIRDWQVAVTFNTLEEIQETATEPEFPDGTFTGFCSTGREDQIAHIQLGPKADEETLVHELGHIVLDDYAAVVDNILADIPARARILAKRCLYLQAERVVNRYTAALMALKNG